MREKCLDTHQQGWGVDIDGLHHLKVLAALQGRQGLLLNKGLHKVAHASVLPFKGWGKTPAGGRNI